MEYPDKITRGASKVEYIRKDIADAEYNNALREGYNQGYKEGYEYGYKERHKAFDS